MHEVTTQELMVFVALGFAGGIFASVYLSKLFEVVHLWRFSQEVIAHCLLMCIKIVEDVSFLTELKRKHMKESDFTDKQIRSFEEVDQRTLTNWKNSVILSLIAGTPKQFQSLMPFSNWKEAVKFLEESNKASVIERKKNYDL
tara:strand:- start:1250 stop:1678 length:429 start_codon:yes stop_codon:yes gene_type:complete